MKWRIPAKTFILGEYVALASGSAIVVTTTPCFELGLVNKAGLGTIHKDSPAGLFWRDQDHSHQGLNWHDPYNGLGGLGASSAQFLACYLADCYLKKKQAKIDELQNLYAHYSWSGHGIKPSGYDVLAQSQRACVYINKQNNLLYNLTWPFADLSFLLLRTKHKLATHEYLEDLSLPDKLVTLNEKVEQAFNAMQSQNSELFIRYIRLFHEELLELNWVAKHTLKLIHDLYTYPEVLAAKGCGALGSDIILILCASDKLNTLKSRLVQERWSILATEKNLFQSIVSINQQAND